MYNMIIYKSIEGNDYDDMKHGLDSLINAKNTLVAIQDTMRCHDICRQYIQMAIDSFIEHDKRREQPVFVYPKAISMMCEDLEKYKKEEEFNKTPVNKILDEYEKMQKENKDLKVKNARLVDSNKKLRLENANLKQTQLKTIKGLEELHSMFK